ncbi:MAG: UDP-3-O-[Alphaproteobacteria bacterium]|nr:UDP-3-O-[3-hydroxymyristoyl] N-acetylglucosamine deacetylase [Alphaproteobacteria bacterium]
MVLQHTLKEITQIKGIGLHSGLDVTLTLKPAPINKGITFYRTDINSTPLRGLYSNVVDTRNCTALGSDSKNIVSTIEHFMATLYILGIDNLDVEIDNAEIPILDGSSRVFLDILKTKPLEAQEAPAKILRVKKEITYEDKEGCRITMLPSDKLEICFDIDFPSPIVGHQNFNNVIDYSVFEQEIAPCRTFCEKYQVDYLKSIGLIKGGSLENAVVLDGNTILNPEGFRIKNECVNHKVLDTIGDLYTSGYRILSKVIAKKTGHRHNNEILKILFSSQDNYEIV